MSNINANFEGIKFKCGEQLYKMRKICREKVNAIMSFTSTPKFIGSDNPQMQLASDGTKACFMFNGTKTARKFAKELSNLMGVTADVDNFIGYGVVYVPADKYEEVIRKGLNMLLELNDGCWVDFYNERAARGFEQVLFFRISDSCFDKNGNVYKGEEAAIKRWIKSLEKVLGQEVLFDEYIRRNFSVGIKRTTDAHLTHEAVLEKIRNSGLLENCPFEGYAYIDYYGRTVR